MTKTIWLFLFNNGDYTQSEHFVGDMNLTEDQATEKATRYMETEYDYDRKYFEITEIYPVWEENIKEVIKSRSY